MRCLLTLPFVFTVLNALEIVAPDSVKKLWVHEGMIERARGFKKTSKSFRDTRIIGGGNALPGRYPYYTYVEFTTEKDGVFFCSATLIWEDILLSAAHCFIDVVSFGANVTSAVAYIGLDNQDNRDTKKIRELERVIPHPSYDLVSWTNDLAIFKLAKPILGIDPVSLNFDKGLPKDGQRVDTFGFGIFNESAPEPDNLPKILQVVDLSIVPFSNCNDANSYDGEIINNTMICAGGQAGKDACDGDSGSPLIIPGANASADIQVGIVSFGVGCGDPDFPGVYTRLSTYDMYIFDQLCKVSDNPPLECDETTAPVPGSPSVTKAPVKSPTITKAPVKSPTTAPTNAPTSSPAKTPTSTPSKSPQSLGVSKSPTIGQSVTPPTPTTSTTTSGPPGGMNGMKMKMNMNMMINTPTAPKGNKMMMAKNMKMENAKVS